MLMSSPIGPFRRTVIYCQVAKETCVLLFRLCFHTHWVLSKMWLNCIDRKRQRMLSAWDSDAPPPLPLTFSLSFLRLTRVLIVSLCKVHAPPLSLSLSFLATLLTIPKMYRHLFFKENTTWLSLFSLAPKSSLKKIFGNPSVWRHEPVSSLPTWKPEQMVLWNTKMQTFFCALE